jgi:integrase
VWEDLFDVSKVMGFVKWHAARLGRSLTSHGYSVAYRIAAMARVLDHPAHPTLNAFARTLYQPPALHVKRNHIIPLALLDEVAGALIAEGRTPLVQRPRATHPGALRACRYQYGVILRLLVNVPLRQRNIREMQIGTHLTQDPTTKHWFLDFRGDDLKIGHRGGEVNTYTIDLTDHCPDWVALLEEWLAVHRRKLPGALESPFVFLTQYGKPYTAGSLYHILSATVSKRTGRRFYPHLVRTMWATECLEDTRDFQVAATMLGDTLTVTIRIYYYLIKKYYNTKAKAFLASALKKPA